MRLRSGPSRNAFTLVELLVVIGSLAVLIGMLLPALVRARDAGRRAKCLSNIRQIGHAMASYIALNHGRLPAQFNNVKDFLDPDVMATQFSFLSLLHSYFSPGAREVYICPSASDTPWNPEEAPTETSATNYLGNAAVFYPIRKVTQIPNSSEIIAVQEDRFLWRVSILRPSAFGTIDCYTRWHSKREDARDEDYTNVHARGGNLLFVDGHAEWRPYKDLRAKDFGLTNDKSTNGDPEDDWTTDHWRPYRFAAVKMGN